MTLADAESRVVVTKDADFVDSHTLLGRPRKLLLISTGNITNAELESLLVPLVPQIVQALENSSLVELGRSGLAVRE
jgi:predicted nuclease of predicted toxin-antitoxin system